MLTARQIARLWIPLALMGWGAGCAPRNVEDQLQLARQAFLSGDDREAEDRLERILASQPSDRLAALAYNDLAVVKWRRGDLDASLKALDESRQRDPNLASAAYNLGIISYQRGNPMEAAAQFEQAEALDPSDPRASEFLAGFEMQGDRWAAAADHLEKAAGRAPQSPRIRTALALTRLRSDDAAGAVEELTQAVEADPGYGPALYNLAVIHDQWLQDVRTASHYLDTFLAVTDDPVRAREARAMKAAWEGEALMSGTLDEAAPTPPASVAEPAASNHSLPEMPPLDVGLADVIAPEPTPSAPEEKRAVPADDRAEVPKPFADQPADAPVRPPTRSTASEQVQRDRSVPIAPPPRPTTVTDLVDLGRRLVRQGRSDEAFRAYRDASEVAAREQQSERVELILREAVAACPSQPGAHYDYGLFLLNQGRPAEALPAFQQAVALAPNWAPPYLGMAETAVRTGQNDAASVALSRALRLDPANREALWGIATLHDLQRHSFQETVQAYHTFLSQYPDDPRADRAKERIRALQSQFRPAPRQDRVTLFGPPRATAAPVVPETLAAPQPLQAEAPEELPVRRPRVRNREAAVAAYNRGTLYQARNDWNRAIDFYIQSLESDDSFSLAYYNLGVAYHSLGSLGLAQQAYEASIGLQPCHVNSRFNLAVLYRETGRTEEAADQLQAALRCDSTHARTHYMLGLIYADSSRTFDLAERHFRRFLRLAPNDAAAVDVRAWLQRPMP